MENEPEGEEPVELTNQGRIRRYVLDRVQHLEITESTFKMPRHFNHRREYLRSLPLHSSQREVERHSNYSIFELRLMPTYDFIKEILSMGGEVEVVSPDYVREEMKRRIQELADRSYIRFVVLHHLLLETNKS